MIRRTLDVTISAHDLGLEVANAAPHEQAEFYVSLMMAYKDAKTKREKGPVQILRASQPRARKIAREISLSCRPCVAEMLKELYDEILRAMIEDGHHPGDGSFADAARRMGK